MRARTASTGGALLAAALAAALAGCGDAVPAFECGRGAACDPGSMCVDASCARLDAMCPSGYRWDETAGDRAGQCAVFPDIGMDQPDLVDPNCGNGRLDPDEECDDSAGVPCPSPRTCDDGEPCSNDDVVGAACHRQCSYRFEKEGTRCSYGDGGAPGACHARACCTGCLTDAGCVSGTAPGSCGGGGSACADCVAKLADCRAGACAMGGCTAEPLPNGVPCPQSDGGTCVGGTCCNGCVNAQGACVAGSAQAACGSGGGKCTDCGGRTCGVPDMGVGYRCIGCLPSCTNKACGDDGCGGSCGACPVNKTCVQGQCQCAGRSEDSDALCGDGIDNDCNGLTDCADPACDGSRCMGMQMGMFCAAKKCSFGCLIGAPKGTFYADGVAPSAGQPCLVCTAKVNDRAATALPDSAPCTQMNLPGSCHLKGTVCCTGCWNANANTCASGKDATACGAGGQACASCSDGNPCTQDACSNGACAHPLAQAGTTCSGCGGGGQCFLNGCRNDCVIYGACNQSGNCDFGLTPKVSCCGNNTQCRGGTNSAQCAP